MSCKKFAVYVSMAYVTTLESSTPNVVAGVLFGSKKSSRNNQTAQANHGRHLLQQALPDIKPVLRASTSWQGFLDEPHKYHLDLSELNFEYSYTKGRRSQLFHSPAASLSGADDVSSVTSDGFTGSSSGSETSSKGSNINISGGSSSSSGNSFSSGSSFDRTLAELEADMDDDEANSDNCTSDSTTCDYLGAGGFGSVFKVSPDQVNLFNPYDLVSASTTASETNSVSSTSSELSLQSFNERKRQLGENLVGKLARVDTFCGWEAPVVFGEYAREFCAERTQNSFVNVMRDFDAKLLDSPVAEWQLGSHDGSLVQYLGFGEVEHKEGDNSNGKRWAMVVMREAGVADLSAYIEKTRQITDENPVMSREQKMQNALIIMRDIYQGVKEIHQRGYIWRDLKPANVMVQTARENPSIVTGATLVDLASIVKAEGTTEGFGTVDYLPFPDMHGDRAAFSVAWESVKVNSQQSDLWALGAVGVDLLLTFAQYVDESYSWKHFKSEGLNKSWGYNVISFLYNQDIDSGAFARAVRLLVGISPKSDPEQVRHDFETRFQSAQHEMDVYVVAHHTAEVIKTKQAREKVFSNAQEAALAGFLLQNGEHVRDIVKVNPGSSSTNSVHIGHKEKNTSRNFLHAPRGAKKGLLQRQASERWGSGEKGRKALLHAISSTEDHQPASPPSLGRQHSMG